MPKMKTKRAAKKRYTLTANGKVKVKKQGMRHILEKHSSKNKRKRRMAGFASQADLGNIKRCLPYG